MRIAFTRKCALPADPALRSAIQDAAAADSNLAEAEKRFGRATSHLQEALAIDESVAPRVKEDAIKAARTNLTRANETYMANLWRSLRLNVEADAAKAKVAGAP